MRTGTGTWSIEPYKQTDSGKVLLTKEEAIEAFKSITKGKILAPKEFNDIKNIEKITGVYIPFWLFDFEVNGDILFEDPMILTTGMSSIVTGFLNTLWVAIVPCVLGLFMSGLAAFAGFFMLMKSPYITNTLGAMPGIKAFTAAVIGGIGSIPGAMLGGILMGVVEAFAYTVPAVAPYTDAIEFLILIIILLVRPSGILAKVRREKV